MICPKCGKDVGDYKYCPDCGVPTIEVDSPAQSSPAPMPTVKAPKKPYAIGRFFAVVAALHIFGTIIIMLSSLVKSKAQMPNYELFCVCALQIIGLVLCFVFTTHIKFWMLFPCLITGFAVMICSFISGYDGRFILLFLIVPHTITSVLLPISKIPRRSDE